MPKNVTQAELEERIRAIEQLRGRIIAAIKAKRSPSFLEMMRLWNFLTLVETGVEPVAGTGLAALHAELLALLPAAHDLCARMVPCDGRSCR